MKELAKSSKMLEVPTGFPGNGTEELLYKVMVVAIQEKIPNTERDKYLKKRAFARVEVWSKGAKLVCFPVNFVEMRGIFGLLKQVRLFADSCDGEKAHIKPVLQRFLQAHAVYHYI